VTAIEEATDAEVRKQYDTNVFGLLNVTRAVLPYLRQQKSGRVINISSLFGYDAVPGWGLYGSTKFAVEGLSKGLAVELAPLGIHVTVVAPGLFTTDFLSAESYVAAKTIIGDYQATVGPIRSGVDALHGHQPGDPKKFAQVDYSTRRYRTSTAAFARREGHDRDVPEQRCKNGTGNRSMAASRYQHRSWPPYNGFDHSLTLTLTLERNEHASLELSKLNLQFNSKNLSGLHWAIAEEWKVSNVNIKPTNRKEIEMSSIDVDHKSMKLEVLVLPVSDVDRAKDF
jgi:hypothetical protein